MQIEITTDEIVKYQENLLRAHDEFNKFVRDYLTLLANYLIQKAIPRTPVDTGRLRRSYKVSAIKIKGNETSITVYNSAKSNGAEESYASFVEFGHFTRGRISWVDGRFMLTISTDELRNEMQKTWDYKFDAWCKGMGIK